MSEESRPAIRVHVTEEKISELPVGVVRRLQTTFAAQFDFIAHFMVDGQQEPLPRAEALAILDQYKMGEVQEIANEIMEARNDPKGR